MILETKTMPTDLTAMLDQMQARCEAKLSPDLSAFERRLELERSAVELRTYFPRAIAALRIAGEALEEFTAADEQYYSDGAVDALAAIREALGGGQ